VVLLSVIERGVTLLSLCELENTMGPCVYFDDINAIISVIEPHEYSTMREMMIMNLNLKT